MYSPWMRSWSEVNWDMEGGRTVGMLKCLRLTDCVIIGLPVRGQQGFSSRVGTSADAFLCFVLSYLQQGKGLSFLHFIMDIVS
jgi:hypothetical protein